MQGKKKINEELTTIIITSLTTNDRRVSEKSTSYRIVRIHILIFGSGDLFKIGLYLSKSRFREQAIRGHRNFLSASQETFQHAPTGATSTHSRLPDITASCKTGSMVLVSPTEILKLAKRVFNKENAAFRDLRFGLYKKDY